MTVIPCGECGVLFALTDDFIKERRKDHQTWYCPNGHSRYYPQDNETEQLRKQVERLKSDRQWHDDMRRAAEADAKHQRRVAAAARGRVTKIKNRIAAGVCPAPGCKRSGLGGDVVAHLKSCHPGFVVDE